MAFPTYAAQNKLAVQQFANTLYNLQCGIVTLNQVNGDINNSEFGRTDDAFNNYYSYSFGTMAPAQVADIICTNYGIVDGQFGLDAAVVAASKIYVASQLAAVAVNARGAVVADLNAMWAGLAGDATFGAAATAWNAEISAALAWEGTNDVVAGTANPAPTVETEFFLTANQDVITGSDQDDTFFADVVQANGPQVNSLGTGDRLDGSDGFDTLVAQVTEGVFMGGGNMPIQPRLHSIEDVQFEALFSNVGLEAFDLNLGSLIHDVMDMANGIIPPGLPIDEILDAVDIVNDTSVYVNAKNIKHFDKIGSYYSDADLTIQDLTVDLDEDELTSDVTVVMAYTGNSDHVWNESDFRVYFDEDYLLAGQRTDESEAYYWLLDEIAWDVINGNLAVNPPSHVGLGANDLLWKSDRNGVTFSLDGVAKQVTIGNLVDANYFEETSHVEYTAALNAELNAMKAVDATLAGLSFSLRPSLTRQTNTDSGDVATVPAIVLIDATGRDLTNPGFSRDLGATGYFDVFGDVGTEDSNTFNLLISVDVELEKVGRGGDGGELVIGGMNKDSDNEWGDGSSTKPAGVEQFDVTVMGGAELPNSLSALKSTNNALQVVNVVSEEGFEVGDAASLQIGNSNTVFGLDVEFMGFEIALGGLSIFTADFDRALKDVRLFDASGFNGDLTLYAGITDESVAKYLDLVDTTPTPTDDNVLFNYIGGAGDDMIALQIDTDVVAHEDADVLIESGAGDDVVVAALMNGAHETGMLASNDFDADTNWYWNQLSSASPYDMNNEFAWVSGYVNNLQIDSGAGDDIVWIPGAGNWSIQLGSGDDVVYTDNTGGFEGGFRMPLQMNGVQNQFSTWMYNTIDFASNNNILGESQSDVNDSYRLYNAKLEVSFLGHEVTVDLNNYSNGMLTDLDINQAIIKAINGDANGTDQRVKSDDPGLSAVLFAYQGEGNALVIASKIDGEMWTDDAPIITITAPTSLSAGEIIQLSNAYGVGANQAAVLAAMNADLLTFVNEGDYDARQAEFAHNGPIVGTESMFHSDNVIEGGLGDDVFVLGTNAGKNNSSNDILVYNGAGNGFDCVYNFDAADFVTNTINLATVGGYVQGANAIPAVTAVAEVFTLNLTGTVDLTPGVITFTAGYFGGAGTTVTPVVGDTATDVAGDIAAAINVLAGNFTAVASGGTVTFTQVAPAAVADVTIANAAAAAIQYDGSGVGMTVGVTTQGVSAVGPIAATAESFTVFFGNATQAATYSFAGVNLPILAGQTANNIAAEAASATYTGWDVTNHTADTNAVTFTSQTLGNIADVTNASWVGANIEVVTYEALASMDMIDFTSYNVVDVYVDGQGYMFGAPLNASSVVIWMDEHPTNLGEYTMKEVTVGANLLPDGTDAVITAIGVLDFGYTPDFVEGQAALVNGAAIGGTFWI